MKKMTLKLLRLKKKKNKKKDKKKDNQNKKIRGIMDYINNNEN